MPKVFITRNIPAVGPQKLRQQSGWDVQQWEKDEVIPRETLLQAVKGCDAILSLLTERIDAELIEAAGPQLKVVANLAVGFDNFVVPEMSQRGVIGTNTPDVLTDTTADLAFSLLMATARMLPQAQKYVLDDKWKTWEPLGFLGQDVHHATLGLVGLGRIGAAMARRGAGFEMKVIYYDAYRRQDLEQQYGYEYRDSVEAVLREADFVSLHTPLMEETRHLMNAERLAMMKKTAILINSSRGPVVDPGALYDALKAGTIWAAGLDVTEPEPLPVTDPLLTLDNCLVVPHIASASIKTRDNMSELAADNIINVLQGRAPKTPVNPEVVKQKGLS
ncbi:MAG TPA: D-glycerate dehydrogenase [Chloroflexota bacterium]|jgi:glyoxylate reductase|nr:D-glycerate dehydrogenase [Chloroflexota bacterium]